MVIGALLTGFIGFFVVVACAATLHASNIQVNSASDAASALAPLAGDLAGTLFAVGLIGAALLAAAVLPLSTAYSVCDFTGSPAAVDLTLGEARLFYLSNLGVTALASLVVLVPSMPLVPLSVSTQMLNAVLLVPLLVLMTRLARDRTIMGAHVVSRKVTAAQVLIVVAVAACVVLLVV